MRILIANKYVHLTGGADQHVLGLAATLRERGHEVRFLSTASPRNEEQDGVFVECSVTHGTRDALGIGGQGRVLERALWNREAADATRRLIDEFRPDVLHAHKLYPQLSVAPVVVAARRGVPVVQTLHDFEMLGASPIDVRGGWWDRDEPRLRYKALNTLTVPIHRRVHVPRVTSFVAVSRFVQRVHASRGIASTVLPNFVPTDQESSNGVPGYDDRRGVLFLGRLRPEKGVADVVGLAARLPKIAVTIVGSGDLEAWAHARARELPNLEVTGFVTDPELNGLIQGARVIVVPSLCQDAGPLVPLEAMGAGTPVVAYANGGLGEYVIDAGGGRVVPPADVVALADAAAELHDDRSLWARLSQHGREAIVERHSPDRYVEKLEGLYEEARR